MCSRRSARSVDAARSHRTDPCWGVISSRDKRVISATRAFPLPPSPSFLVRRVRRTCTHSVLHVCHKRGNYSWSRHAMTVTARNRLSHPSSLVWRILPSCEKPSRGTGARVLIERKRVTPVLYVAISKNAKVIVSPFTLLISWRLRGRTIVRAKRVLLSRRILLVPRFHARLFPSSSRARWSASLARPTRPSIAIESRRPGCITRRRGTCPGA